MASSCSRISDLAAIIGAHTNQVDSYIAQKSLTYPSFNADSPVDLGLPQDIEKSRVAVLEATQELNELLQGPRSLLFNHQHNVLLYLKLISRLDLAKKVPVNGEATFADLAAATGVDQDAMTRILRLAIAHRVFREGSTPESIAHSAASRQIADDPLIADWAGANVDEMWPSAEKTVEALVKWPLAAEPDQTGFSLAHGTGDSFYATIAKNPERARRFGGAMSFFTTGEGYSLHHLTDGYPWESVDSGCGTVIDLGGSRGDAAFAISSKYPGLRLIVQELPEVVTDCKDEGNVKFMRHNFFEEQPIKHADIYFYRWIFHNWPDKYCIKILRALIPALKQGSKVLIMDFVMPPVGVLPNSLERSLRAMDVTMLEIGNAKERNLQEWETLFSSTDERFKFKGMNQPPGSRLALLEFVWEE